MSAWDMGAVAVGATIYFGSEESTRQITEIAEAFQHAHELGMATILWCYLRNPGFKVDGKDYHTAADLTGAGQPPGRHHPGGYHQAEAARGQWWLQRVDGYGKTHKKVYSDLSSDHPIDLCRYQVANCYMGRIGLINSGGASSGASDMAEAVRTAVINKRAGGQGLISGRKAFQRPMSEGIPC